MINAKHEGKLRQLAHIGTGNFHEGTANVYSDISLLTADHRLTSEVEKVFRFIEKPYIWVTFEHLLVSPIYLRTALLGLIEGEIEKAKSGKKAYIFLKLNSLVDQAMIKKLYEANGHGVKIQLLVRGICSLIPGEKGLSENITAASIIDKYLEHARIYVFGATSDRKYYLSSADWMTRNLDFRIEVATPVYDNDSKLQEEIQRFINIQLKDNVKTRKFNRAMTNEYQNGAKKKVRSQVEFYEYLKKNQ